MLPLQPNQARQGDILFVRISDEEIAKAKEIAQGNFTLLMGEATGHAHTLIAAPDVATILEMAGVTMIRVVGEKAEVTHPEHGTITLDKGNYKMVRQQEWIDNSWATVLD